MEKFKIVSDETGEHARVYIDGEEITRVTDIVMQVNAGYGIDLKIMRYKTDQKGDCVWDDDMTDVLREELQHQFYHDFSKFMNPPEECD